MVTATDYTWYLFFH